MPLLRRALMRMRKAVHDAEEEMKQCAAYSPCQWCCAYTTVIDAGRAAAGGQSTSTSLVRGRQRLV
jgi:hypothetical protein